MDIQAQDMRSETIRDVAGEKAPVRRPERHTVKDITHPRALDIRIIAPPDGGFIIVQGGEAMRAYSSWIDLILALKAVVAALPGEDKFEATVEQLREMLGKAEAKRGGLWG